MDQRKCCVVDCSSTTKTHRLFNLPMDDTLRNLWLSFLVPVNVNLSGLSKYQLIKKRVCQNHFDRYQFDNRGNRLQHGYPCLFTSKEILHGIPLSSSVGDALSDHNYSLQTTTEECNKPTAHVVIEGDHTYTSRNLPVPVLMEVMICEDGVAAEETIKDYPSTSTFLMTEAMEKTCEVKSLISQKSRVKKRSEGRIQKSMSSVNTKKQKTTTENVTEMQNIFKKNFVNMPHNAQNFLMMQLKLVDKNKTAMRFTDDEKLLSLTLMKESPKGYRLLQKIFKLPTKRTLNRLSEKIKFNVGLNENIFNLLQKKVRTWTSI